MWGGRMLEVLKSPEMWIPLCLIWAPAIVVGSVWAKRSLVYGFVTMLVAIPCLYFAWLIALFGTAFLVMAIGWFTGDLIPPVAQGFVTLVAAHGLTLWVWIRYLKGAREEPDTKMWAPGMPKAAPKKSPSPFQRKMR